MASRYDWSGTWVDQDLLLMFTAVSVSDPSHVLGALGRRGLTATV